MTTTLLLRVASVISLIFTAGHTLGGLRKWSPMGENEVLNAMTEVRFDTRGANRSYLDFFMGFGWSISVFMLLQTVLLWQLASLVRAEPAGVRPMIAVFGLATLASGVIAWRFIFPVPALFSSALLNVLLAAYVVARKCGSLSWRSFMLSRGITSAANRSICCRSSKSGFSKIISAPASNTSRNPCTHASGGPATATGPSPLMPK